MKAHVTIKTRDLDTDAKEIATVEVEPALDPAAQRSQLARLVEEHHPDACLRSFAQGTASFMTREHLIVASYSKLPSRPRATPTPEPSVQEPLFVR